MRVILLLAIVLLAACDNQSSNQPASPAEAPDNAAEQAAEAPAAEQHHHSKRDQQNRIGVHCIRSLHVDLKLKSAAARRSADRRPLKFTCYATALAEFAEWQQSRTTLQQYARFTQQDSFATDESAASAASVTSVDVAAAAPRWQHSR